MSNNSKGEKKKKITDYTIRNKETKERKESSKTTGALKRPIGVTSPTKNCLQPRNKSCQLETKIKRLKQVRT